MDTLRQLTKLSEGGRQARPAPPPRSGAACSGPAGSFDSSSPSDIAIETSRCCVPSCRSRSIRRRSASVASTKRARDACSSASLARSSALQPLVLERQPRCRTDRVDQLGVVLAAPSRGSRRAIGWPSRSTAVERRSEPGSGSAIDLPSLST